MVYVDNPTQPALGVAVDLSQLLNLSAGQAFVGFTAATGGLAEVHELVSWSFDESAPPSGNTPPNAPIVSEPTINGAVVNAADVHMETGPFSDPNAGDTHVCTDWEIWTLTPLARVWSTACIGGVEKLHTHVGDGVFEGSHAGRTELFASTSYKLRVRHRDSSADPLTEWSAWSERTFVTGGITQVFPLEIEDVLALPAPRWIVASTGADVILVPATTNPSLRLESGVPDLALSIAANDGDHAVAHFAPFSAHVAVRATARRLQRSQLAGHEPGRRSTTTARLTPSCRPRSTRPARPPYWIAVSGATYADSPADGAELPRSRGPEPPWRGKRASRSRSSPAASVAGRPGSCPTPDPTRAIRSSTSPSSTERSRSSPAIARCRPTSRACPLQSDGRSRLGR